MYYFLFVPGEEKIRLRVSGVSHHFAEIVGYPDHLSKTGQNIKLIAQEMNS